MINKAAATMTIAGRVTIPIDRNTLHLDLTSMVLVINDSKDMCGWISKFRIIRCGLLPFLFILVRFLGRRPTG